VKELVVPQYDSGEPYTDKLGVKERVVRHGEVRTAVHPKRAKEDELGRKRDDTDVWR
jgi:hypothetical protein